MNDSQRECSCTPSMEGCRCGYMKQYNREEEERWRNYKEKVYYSGTIRISSQIINKLNKEEK